ncbi:aspartyl/asparaginyl beta-hydroxylase isoform X8 [Gadus morhua]|uniref:aspartyl/asparaginyl beta-hydroxylase isoform X8 n=1 Tax=Gadus morhua TaxID=8049 RepID=UPI0011B7E2FC|nr:aspartyl/asparaginyl beta-hydroxylase-like isoform X8 [Gadus morhua]
METCRPRDSSSTASGKELYMEEEEEEVMYEEELCDDEEEVASAVQDIGGLNEAEKPLVGAEVCPYLRDSDGKPTADSKNGLKSDGGAAAAAGAAAAGGVGPKTTMFTWFVVLALLGVWSSVAVVYFDVVDYDSVIARAKEFRVNFSEVLQGKLMAYDRDGDGDFDMEDAKVLLDDEKLNGATVPKKGLKTEETQDVKNIDRRKEKVIEVLLPDIELPRGLKDPVTFEVGGRPAEEHDRAPPADTQDPDRDRPADTQDPGRVRPDDTQDPGRDRPADTQDPDRDRPADTQDPDRDRPADTQDPAVRPQPPLVEDFVPDDPREDSGHPYEDEVETIDTTGVLVDEVMAEETMVESGKYVTSSKVSQETESRSDQKVKEKTKKSKPKLLNKLDKTIKVEIDAAEKLRKKGKVEEALKSFEALVQRFPQSPRARYGKAQAEDDVAEKQRSNDLLQRAINSYREASELPSATPDLIRVTLKRRAERQQFLGRNRGALLTLERLVEVFPEDLGLKNDLGVAHLLIGDNKGAKRVYEEVLAVAPGDGFALVHYGFILKSENQIAESIPYLKGGLESGAPGTDDGRFYFHLGDALQRVGDDSAYHWYELGHQRGHFASVWQRSLYNVDGLQAQPWWTPQETGYTDLVKALERGWKAIREEVLAVLDLKTGLFMPEEENLRERGEWGQYTLWQQGRKAGDACRSVPKTCSLLERFPEATNCKRGQIKFSVMQPGTHVWPHTGPTNCRLRMHLGLVVPEKGCRIRCTNQTREWEEGKVLIFDDSFEHEVWQEAASYRLILIVDVWHPALSAHQRQTLSPI